MASLLTELRRRNVFRVAVGYLVLAWVVLQITDLLAPALLLPEWTLSLVTFLGILGFPFALFFAWAFELTPEGIKRSTEVDPQESITGQTAGALNKLIIALLCAAVAILLADKYLNFGALLAPPAAEVELAAEPAPAPVEEDSKPRSIAVLPFVNMSNDPEQEYFSDGISEELLNALAQIRELRVAARTSSFAFKGKNQDITNIGEQLKVETVLEGSVRKAGPRVRIVAQLISVDDGYHLWSETYDRDLTDIFAVQDEISASIVDALRLHLEAGDVLDEKQAVNIDAYNLFLQGRHNVRQRNPAALEVALKQFQQAIDIDSNYAQPWAGKALATQLLREDSYGDIPAEQADEITQGYLDMAFSLDPELGEAHAAQALLFQSIGRCEDSIASINKALKKMPGEGILYTWRSFCLQSLGHYADASEAVMRGFEMDPLHPSVRINWFQAQADAGNFDAIRNVVTDGTTEFYLAEFVIAEAEGRRADQYTALLKADNIQQLERNEFYRHLVELQWLGKTDQPAGSWSGHFKEMLDAIFRPEAVAAELENFQASDLSLEQRHVMSLALISLGRCKNLIPYLQPMGLEELERFGDPDDGDSNFNFASVYAYCLWQAGEENRAADLARILLQYFDEAVDAGFPSANWVERRALLLLILGEEKQAVDSLRQVHESHDLPVLNFVGFTKLYGESLIDREDFRLLGEDIERKMNEERAQLGWPPKRLSDIL